MDRRSERMFRECMEDFRSRQNKRNESEDDYFVKLKIELDCEWDDELLLAIMNIWQAGYMVGEGNTLKVEDERWVANAKAIDAEFKRRIASYGN